MYCSLHLYSIYIYFYLRFYLHLFFLLHLFYRYIYFSFTYILSFLYSSSCLLPHSLSKMRFDIADSLLDWQDKRSHWPSSPVIKHDGVLVDLSDAVGKQAKTPDHAPNQPYIHPKKSAYQFDPKRFSGPDAHSDLTELLKTSCPGCKLYGQK